MTQLALSSLGCQNLKEVIVLGLDTYIAMKNSYADGKLTFSDYVNFLPVVKDVGPAVTGITEVLPELKDLDTSEQEDICELIHDKLPGEVSVDNWVFYAEHSIKIGLSLWALLSKTVLSGDK